MLILGHRGRDSHHLSAEIWRRQPLFLAPIVHPQRYHDLDDLTGIFIPYSMLKSGVHPLLASILAPRVPQICQDTAISCIRYLQSGSHSVKSRKSLKPLLKSRYFTRLKMRPSLSRFRKRRHRHSSARCLLDEQDLHSMWWGDHPKRPKDSIYCNKDDEDDEYKDDDEDKDDDEGYKGCKEGVRVPLCFFSYRLEYASNYDLWYTYRCALQLLPLVLANAPPDSHLASIATNCIFDSFCTAYPQETKKAKKSMARYLCRCRPIRAMPSSGRIVGTF